MSRDNSSTKGFLALTMVLAVLGTAFPMGPVVYLKEKVAFPLSSGGEAKGYRVRARASYPYPIKNVLDASHDHLHLSQKDGDIEREEVVVADCSKEFCRINVHVVVGSFFAVGEIDYELDTEVHTQEDGGFLIEWDKRSDTRFIKHLRGELRLTPTGEDAEHTDIDYLIEVAAPRLSTEKLAAKAEAYLARLASILEERHQGHPSLWEGMKDRM